MDESQRLKVQEAAAVCGVSDDTIYRRLKGGQFPNARQEGGAWLVPLADLVRGGLRPQLSRLGDATDPVRPAGVKSKPGSMHEELAELRETLVRLQARASAAEALASARAEHIRDLRTALGHHDQMHLFEPELVK